MAKGDKKIADQLAAEYGIETEPTAEVQDSTWLHTVDPDQWVYQERNLESGHTIGFAAKDVRPERTGVHARIEIRLGNVVLAWTNGNIERDEDRVRLCNSARKKLPKLIETIYLAPQMKHDLDMFCLRLWDKYNDQFVGSYLAGDPSPRPVSYWLKPYCLEGGGTFLFAPPGSTKSYTALIMAITINAGLDFPWVTTRTNVLFVNLERSAASIARRIGNINAILGLPRDEELLVINARGKTLHGISEAIRKTVAQYAVGLVIVDSVSRMGAGKLVEDSAVNSTIDLLNECCPSWFALAHSPRADASHIFGSQMFDAGGDIMIHQQAETQGENVGVKLTITKANDVATGQPTYLEYTFDPEHGLTGVKRLRPGDIYKYPTLVEEKQDIVDEIEGYLKDVTRATATQIGVAINKSRESVLYHLNREDRFVRLPKIGKEQLFALKAWEVYQPKAYKD